MSDQEV